MKQATINLYEFSELSSKAQETAISEHKEFLLSIGFECENEDGEMVTEYPEDMPDIEVVENIEANEYLFYSDGKLANCTTYCGKHPKAGVTEFTIHGQTVEI